MTDYGVTLDKASVRDILIALVEGEPRWFSEGRLGIEQATNRIGSLQRPPSDWVAVALTVGCPYCGRTPGNTCQRGGNAVDPHPSRFRDALRRGSEPLVGTDEPCGYCHRRPPVGESFAMTGDGIRICKGCAA